MAVRSPTLLVSSAAGTLEISDPTPTSVTMSAAMAMLAPRSLADIAMMGVTAPRPTEYKREGEYTFSAMLRRLKV